MLVVVESLPEADPDVEHSQTGADAPEESAGNERPQAGEGEEQVIVGPFRRPGENDQQNPGNRADQYEEQDGTAVQPELQAGGRRRGKRLARRIEQGCASLRRRRLCRLRGIRRNRSGIRGQARLPSEGPRSPGATRTG